MPDKNSNQTTPMEIHPNLDLPNIWVDNMGIGIRDDGVCILRFSTQLPEGHFEQTRVLTKRRNLEIMIESLCGALDYYPKKNIPKIKKKKK